jgi:hypothetical protein
MLLRSCLCAVGVRKPQLLRVQVAVAAYRFAGGANRRGAEHCAANPGHGQQDKAEGGGRSVNVCWWCQQPVVDNVAVAA